MKRTITSEILVSYSLCPRKAYLLLCTNQRGTPNEYMSILQQQKQALQRDYIKDLKQKNPDALSYSIDNLKNGSEFLVNAKLKADEFEAEYGILTKVAGSSAFGRYSYEPTLFIGTHKIDKYQKLALFFVGYVLEQIQGKQPAVGRIVGVDGKSHRVKLENSSKALGPLLEPLQELIQTLSPDPPALILNKYCIYCQFQNMCRDQAEQEDNLSLLDRVTPRLVRRYERRGIFTIKQLSYLFKPKKRKKRASKSLLIHKPALQALAIRTDKIYLQELPELTRHPVELFVDVEGVPDQRFYYLIGVLVCEADKHTQYSFWADTLGDEAKIWQQFVNKVNQYPDAPIYHYGSYEPRAIAQLARRYGTDGKFIKDRLVNVNSYIYARIYFPVRSNQLKEIGSFIGASWTSPNASGLQSLVWRYHWDETRSEKYQQLLLTYNTEDCIALKLLTDELSRIRHSADTLSEVDFVNQPKQHATEIGEEIHSQFKALLRFAHSDYDKKKISFRPDQPKRERKKPGPKVGSKRDRKAKPKAMKSIQVPMRKTCSRCENTSLRSTKQVCRRTIIDLILTRSGIRKTVIEYTGFLAYCPRCRKRYSPQGILRYKTSRLYEHGVKAWVVYHRVALRLSYTQITESLREHFNEKTPLTSLLNMMSELARYYIQTEELTTQHLLESPIIHADETPVDIQDITQYVWVFTDGNHVIFRLTETREASIVHGLLANYDGVLVSDFYSGYDSIQCRQQKCWSHFIRELNSDLRANPFDAEYEVFIIETRNLIVPIMEAIQKYGLKKRNLGKFRKQVDRFYRRIIEDRLYKSDLVLKHQKRFIRYRDSLFTFLEYDGIPWHNNTAETAIRHFALFRDATKPIYESGVRDYLVMLGIRQTCRFQDKSFFRFIFSGEKDIDKFR